MKQYLVTLREGCISYTINGRKFLPDRAKVISENEVELFKNSGAFNVVPYGESTQVKKKTTQKGKANEVISSRALKNLEDQGPIAVEDKNGLAKRESELVEVEKTNRPKGTITTDMIKG